MIFPFIGENGNGVANKKQDLGQEKRECYKGEMIIITIVSNQKPQKRTRKCEGRRKV